MPPGMRPPGWAARDALMAAGLATPEDLDRWQPAFERVDQRQPRPFAFTPFLFAFGRRPPG